MRKIIATIGPATWNKEELTKCIRQGATIFRVNSAFADISELSKVENLLNEICNDLGKILHQDIHLLLDTKGTEFRLGDFTAREIAVGDHIVISTNAELGIKLKFLEIIADQLIVGDIITVDKNKLKFAIVNISKVGNDFLITLSAINNGTLIPKKGVTFQKDLDQSKYLVDAERPLINYVVAQKWTYLALSMIENRSQVEEVVNFIKEFGDIKLVAKIETYRGITNLDTFIEYIDSVMTARGDLSANIKHKELLGMERKIKSIVDNAGKTSIMATGLLDGMIAHSEPSISNIVDILIASEIGYDVFMLSDETSIGRDPSACIAKLAELIA